MSIEKQVAERSGGCCELCGATDNLSVYEVPPAKPADSDYALMGCSVCLGQINDRETMDPNHWRCLNDSMWSQTPGVQAVAWRMLQRLRGEGWPVDLLEMLYIEEETLVWAAATGEGEDPESIVKHVDSNGNELKAGDSVTLIKSLEVKGANFTAKRGTAVRNISLVESNPAHIEGRVNGQHIVILTKFVKKSS